MRSERLLYIGGWSLLQGSNHRTKHVASYLAPRFKQVDLVAFQSSYTGMDTAGESPLHKAQAGAENLLHDRISVQGSEGLREILVRDVPGPSPLHLLGKDLWRYWALRPALEEPYDIAIFGDPENALMARQLKRAGYVRHLIYDDWDYFPGLEAQPLLQRLYRWRERVCMEAADAVISVGSLLGSLRQEQGARRSYIVPNGVNLDLFARARNKAPHPPTLVFMGTLSSLWGVDVAIRAMPAIRARVPDARLLIAGSGEDEAALKALSESLGMADSIEFRGQMAYEDLPDVLAQADIGLATSQQGSLFRKYASPLKLIEYMAAGLPVIASRIGQTTVTMEEAGAGILIEHTPDALAEAAITLLTDPARYQHDAQAAVDYAARFDWSRLVEQVYDIISDVIEETAAVH